MGYPIALPDPLTPAGRALFGLAGLATTGISGDLTLTKTGTTARTGTFPDADIEVQATAEVISGNWTARNHATYNVIASAAATDPATPAAGHEFTTLVRNGTMTTSRGSYAVSGTLVRSVWHSGSWTDYPYGPLNAANTWTAAQAFRANGSHFFGIVGTTGLTNVTADGGNSGTNGGASYFVRGNGATTAAWGNFSSILGGAYDARTTIYSASTDIVFQHGGTTSATLSTGGNWGLAVTPTAGNGLLQRASGTTRASGDAWGTDTFLWRDAANSLITEGAFRSNGATSGIGYATGAGGTVTQATSKSPGVTLSRVCGTITLNAASLAANTSVAFTWTNTAILAGDFIAIQHDSAGTLGAYSIRVTPGSGTATVTVRNNTAGALAEAIVLRFAIIKAVTA